MQTRMVMFTISLRILIFVQNRLLFTKRDILWLDCINEKKEKIKTSFISRQSYGADIMDVSSTQHKRLRGAPDGPAPPFTFSFTEQQSLFISTPAPLLQADQLSAALSQEYRLPPSERLEKLLRQRYSRETTDGDGRYSAALETHTILTRGRSPEARGWVGKYSPETTSMVSTSMASTSMASTSMASTSRASSRVSPKVPRRKNRKSPRQPLRTTKKKKSIASAPRLSRRRKRSLPVSNERSPGEASSAAGPTHQTPQDEEDASRPNSRESERAMEDSPNAWGKPVPPSTRASVSMLCDNGPGNSAPLHPSLVFGLAWDSG